MLLDEAFGLFSDRRRDLPSSEAWLLLEELTEVCCEWYDSESQRQEATRIVFDEYGLKFMYTTDYYSRESRTENNAQPMAIYPSR
jgi:hypothetical protein